MLVHFSFKNFMSYKDETEFDFQAVAIPEFSDSLISIEKATPLLPVGVVYGPNGGGKTNLLHALACLVNIVVKPIVNMEKNREPFVFQENIPYIPFMLDDESRNYSTEFQIYFRKNGNEYRYYIELLRSEIISESLYWRAIGGKRTGTVFEREKADITLGASLRKNRINTLVNPKMPFLSFLAINYDIPVINEVGNWFESCIIRNYTIPQENYSTYTINEDNTKKIFIQALNDMDIDIVDYRFDKEEKQLYLKRKVNAKYYELPISVESDGTKKLLNVLPVIIIALLKGRLVIVDELDAKLHPKLLRYIIKLFKDPELNCEHAQLLFTSHDLTTMRNTVFRRDEIWFAAIDDNHSSKIYSLYDLRDEHGNHINNTAAFDKQYLEGKYGADPYLQNMLRGDWS